MISAGHIERASKSESSDYENCSSSDDSLGTDVGTSANETLYYACNMQSSTYCTLWLSSQTADPPRLITTDCQQWFVETLFLKIMPNCLADNITGHSCDPYVL